MGAGGRRKSSPHSPLEGMYSLTSLWPDVSPCGTGIILNRSSSQNDADATNGHLRRKRGKDHEYTSPQREPSAE